MKIDKKGRLLPALISGGLFLTLYWGGEWYKESQAKPAVNPPVTIEKPKG